MKLSIWAWGGIVLSFGVFGLSAWLGFFQPGGISASEGAGEGGQPPDLKRPALQPKLAEELSGLPQARATSNESESSHRLFVSRTLLFIPNEEEQVQPMDPAFVTGDGIQVGWKIQHGFDPADPEVAGRDDDNDGFSNAEEFEKKTDPRDPASTPSKWVKLRFLSAEPASLSLEFPGKWTQEQEAQADRFTLRLRDTRIRSGKREKAFDIDVSTGDRLWVAATGKNVKIFRSEEEARQDPGIGTALHLIPIQIKSYQPNLGKRPDPVTQLEVAFDDSTLSGERLDGLRQAFVLSVDGKDAKGQTLSRGVTWDVSDYRLISLVPGEGEMGPFRAGQTFSYSGKEFLFFEGKKDRAILKLLPENEELQVFPKTP